MLAAFDAIDLAPGEAEELLPIVASLIEAASIVEELEAPLPTPLPANRDPGYRPRSQEDPYNVFITKCRVNGVCHGPLAGRTVGLKDSISLAGVPTTNGSRLTPHTPLVDAVVVERILHAGGVIVGKLNMDDFSAAGTGETSAFGPPRNPVNPAYSAGGSSGGSGAAVRASEVDLALAVDSGGSGRVPAAFCGVVAVKATQGLVPSFGVAHIDHTIDSVVPVARTVGDAALLLEVIAGSDWRDPQWVRGEILTARYAEACHEGVRGLRIGIVEESCAERYCQPAVLEGVGATAAVLTQAGASVERISIPIWERALAIFYPYLVHLYANMIRSEGVGYGHLGAIEVDTMEAFAGARRTESRALARHIKCWMIGERFLHERFANVPYGCLQNLRLLVRQQISEALERYDLLLTPTVPVTAPRLQEGTPSFTQVSALTTGLVGYNTAPLNLSCHPTVTVPSGVDEAGLPTAVQIVASHFDEPTAFRVAFAVERALGPFCPQ